MDKEALIKMAVIFLVIYFVLTILMVLSCLVQSKGSAFMNVFTDRAWRVNWDWIDSTKDKAAFDAKVAVWKTSTEHKDSYPAPASGFRADLALEKSVAPGLHQRYDQGRSDTGDAGTTLNARTAENSAASGFQGRRSGLTGAREAPMFPEGSLYNIEGKMRGSGVDIGAEGFRRSRFGPEFNPEEQLHG